MRGKDAEQKAFSRIVKKVPDWKINAYEINQVLEAYNKTREQLIAELGEAGFFQFEAKTAHELVQELGVNARAAEEYRTHEKIAVTGSDGFTHYVWQPKETKPNE
jgi:predicted transcriptional regulator YheO